MPSELETGVKQWHNILKAATKTRDRRLEEVAELRREKNQKYDRELDYQNTCVIQARLRWEEAVTAGLERALLSLASIQKKLEPPAPPELEPPSGPC